jgi:hypothetical protein
MDLANLSQVQSKSRKWWSDKLQNMHFGDHHTETTNTQSAHPRTSTVANACAWAETSGGKERIDDSSR